MSQCLEVHSIKRRQPSEIMRCARISFLITSLPETLKSVVTATHDVLLRDHEVGGSNPLGPIFLSFIYAFMPPEGVNFKSYRWQKHSRGLYQIPTAARAR